jgi:hypothetical protein
LLSSFSIDCAAALPVLHSALPALLYCLRCCIDCASFSIDCAAALTALLLLQSTIAGGVSVATGIAAATTAVL